MNKKCCNIKFQVKAFKHAWHAFITLVRRDQLHLNTKKNNFIYKWPPEVFNGIEKKTV